MNRRIKYLIWAMGKRLVGQDIVCPSCGSAQSAGIDRKFIVTSLQRCADCALMFRAPVSSDEDMARFYQSDYAEGFTTDMPSDAELEGLKARAFAGTDRDYALYIEVLKAVGGKPGARLFDFGCSWGYGSWQLERAGFDVEAFEISAPRRSYAADRLGIVTHDSTDKPVGPYDIFFSSHVLEHVPAPSRVFDLAFDLLAPGGLFIAFTPNGSQARRRESPNSWHKHWSMVHPNLIDDVYYNWQFSAAARLMASCDHAGGGARYDMAALATAQLCDRQRTEFDLTGDELLFVARKALGMKAWNGLGHPLLA